MKFKGDRRHVNAVEALMKEEIQHGRIAVTATTVQFLPEREALVMVERALDRAQPGWRNSPLEHLHSFPQPRPRYMLLLSIRDWICKQQGLNPRNT